MQKYVKLLCVFVLATGFIEPLHAMLSDGIHQQRDYEDLANESTEFDSTCYVLDHKAQISQTGVLIAPDLVATAAHGVIEMIQKRQQEPMNQPLPVEQVDVTFINNGQIFTAQAACVLVDARYTENSGLQAKHDIALIKLKQPIHHIRPAKLFEKKTVPSQSVLTVVSFGMADQPKNPAIKRAFRLYERDTYHVGGLDEEELASKRSLLQSSLFFKPDKKLTQPSEQADEETIRVFDATQNWIKDGEKPYALALPGTSGAPVFVRITENGKTEDYLFGVVTSFAHLSGQFQAPKGVPEDEYILTRRQQSFNNYQTIFALFYKEDNNPITYDKAARDYFLDSTFIRLLERIKRF
ncbi:trypsin-like serine peptidase [Candidatus Finniella inopinata]|uniref:Serine protease n=1 Tax=Candidatus Finniella inopinata TaxID=1696036 RepID=A0A4V2E030_9PROT|nr:trypsin-like serine protease [Candidatus Finniella inopinata]RZI47127.1 serine protease [Candidatus Finniella inopinata]